MQNPTSIIATSPIIVTGLGRCGSSLVMDMLSKAGIPMLGNTSYPSYELNSNDFWVLDRLMVEKSRANDKNYAVKILHQPHLDKLDVKKYRVILLKRDFRQQTLSQEKMLNVMGEKVDLRAYQKLLVRDFEILERSLKYCVTLKMDFEDLIINPIGIAKQISVFLGNHERVEEMANCVISRSPDNFHGFMEFRQIANETNLVQS
jgi:hypothetical protein